MPQQLSETTLGVVGAALASAATAAAYAYRALRLIRRMQQPRPSERAHAALVAELRSTIVQLNGLVAQLRRMLVGKNTTGAPPGGSTPVRGDGDA